MVKIRNKKRLEWCLKRYSKGEASQKDLAKMLDITPRRFRQLYVAYKTTNSMPCIGQSLGRPKKRLDPSSKQLIVETHDKYCLNAVYLKKVIFANKRDKEGNAEHAFETFLKEHDIKPILCRYKHPQSNGKIERWWGIYETHRKRFKTFQEFVEWYNNRPHGSLNLRRAETPEQAFWRRLPGEYYYNLATKFLRW
ncbi:transposase [Candidatus Woesearchaeota archaeon]|nr:transposase [Candidatus Woesearchaeota archaeon]